MKTSHSLVLLLLAADSISAAGAQEALMVREDVSPASQATTLNPLSAVPLSELTSFFNRPLFSPSRRPPSTTPPLQLIAPPPTSAPKADNLRLVGTLTTEAGASAVIQKTGSETTLSASRGQTVDGWRIVDIGTATVRIEQRGLQVTLEMFRVSDAPTLQAPQPVAGTAASLPDDAIGRKIPLRIVSRGAASALVPGNARNPISLGAVPAGTVKGTAAASAAAQSEYKLEFGAPPTPETTQ